KVYKIKKHKDKIEYIIDDPLIHTDYWNLLSPKAIGYSAGVIDHFTKQFTQVDQENKKLGFWNKAWNLPSNIYQGSKYIWGDVGIAVVSPVTSEVPGILISTKQGAIIAGKAIYNGAVWTANTTYDGILWTGNTAIGIGSFAGNTAYQGLVILDKNITKGIVVAEDKIDTLIQSLNQEKRPIAANQTTSIFPGVIKPDSYATNKQPKPKQLEFIQGPSLDNLLIVQGPSLDNSILATRAKKQENLNNLQNQLRQVLQAIKQLRAQEKDHSNQGLPLVSSENQGKVTNNQKTTTQPAVVFVYYGGGGSLAVVPTLPQITENSQTATTTDTPTATTTNSTATSTEYQATTTATSTDRQLTATSTDLEADNTINFPGTPLFSVPLSDSRSYVGIHAITELWNRYGNGSFTERVGVSFQPTNNLNNIQYVSFYLFKQKTSWVYDLKNAHIKIWEFTKEGNGSLLATATILNETIPPFISYEDSITPTKILLSNTINFYTGNTYYLAFERDFAPSNLGNSAIGLYYSKNTDNFPEVNTVWARALSRDLLYIPNPRDFFTLNDDIPFALYDGNNEQLIPSIASFSLTDQITGSGNYTSSTTINVLINAENEEQITNYSLSASTVAQTWTQNKPTSFTLNPDNGEQTVYLRFSYGGNNIFATSTSIILDTVSPITTFTSLDSQYSNTGFQLNYSATDLTSGILNYDIQYKTGDVWQDWINATTSANTIFNREIPLNQTVFFRARATDNAGNTGDWSNEIQTQIEEEQTEEEKHLVISELKVAGTTVNQEFIELYNPTNNDIDLSDYSIQYRGSEAEQFEKKNIKADNTIIPSKSYFLIAPKDFVYIYPNSTLVQHGGIIMDVVRPDMEHSIFSLSGNGGTVFLVNDHINLVNSVATSSAIVDQLSYGTGLYLFPENTPAPAPNSSQTLERKANAASTPETMANGEYKTNG
ncbi:lamin tail domain-containing protein, partial [Patescibacteria group bacterium]|nr:lamin tail domain-containing protein [Patescibacteria group bacterium]